MTTLNLGNENFTAQLGEQFNEFSKSAIDVASKLTRITFDSAERLLALNLTTAKDHKGVETGPAVVTDYLKSLYDISAAAQTQYAALIQERVSAFQQSLFSGIDQVTAKTKSK